MGVLWEKQIGTFALGRWSFFSHCVWVHLQPSELVPLVAMLFLLLDWASSNFAHRPLSVCSLYILENETYMSLCCHLNEPYLFQALTISLLSLIEFKWIWKDKLTCAHVFQCSGYLYQKYSITYLFQAYLFELFLLQIYMDMKRHNIIIMNYWEWESY